MYIYICIEREREIREVLLCLVEVLCDISLSIGRARPSRRARGGSRCGPSRHAVGAGTSGDDAWQKHLLYNDVFFFIFLRICLLLLVYYFIFIFIYDNLLLAQDKGGPCKGGFLNKLLF